MDITNMNNMSSIMLKCLCFKGRIGHAWISDISAVRITAGEAWMHLSIDTAG